MTHDTRFFFVDPLECDDNYDFLKCRTFAPSGHLPADMSKLQSKARDRSLGLIMNITALGDTVLSKLFHLPKPRRNGQIRF